MALTGGVNRGALPIKVRVRDDFLSTGKADKTYREELHYGVVGQSVVPLAPRCYGLSS